MLCPTHSHIVSHVHIVSCSADALRHANRLHHNAKLSQMFWRRSYSRQYRSALSLFILKIIIRFLHLSIELLFKDFYMDNLKLTYTKGIFNRDQRFCLFERNAIRKQGLTDRPCNNPSCSLLQWWFVDFLLIECCVSHQKFGPWLLKICFSLLRKTSRVLGDGWNLRNDTLWLTDPRPPRSIHSCFAYTYFTLNWVLWYRVWVTTGQVNLNFKLPIYSLS